MSATIVYWHWLALGGILAAIEMLAPGVFFLWLGVAAVLTGLLLLILPDLAWTLQILVFAVLAIASVYAGRRFFSFDRSEPEDHKGLNRRGQRLVGEVFTLDEATVDGRGRLKVGDGAWRIESISGDLAAGARVRVVAVDGTTLRVEAADGTEAAS